MHRMLADATLLFDGQCGLCHRLVRFIARRDHARRISFAPLESKYARGVLEGYGVDAEKLDAAVLVVHAQPSGRRDFSPAINTTRTEVRATRSKGIRDGNGDRILTGARAALHSLKLLGGGWRLLATLAGILPGAVLRFGYNAIARNRYRWFGKADACALDPALLKGRLVDGA